MKLRRLEFAILALTLAFGIFMGGFFTGRSYRSVDVTAVTGGSQGETSVSISVSTQEPAVQPADATPQATGTSAQDKDEQNKTENSKPQGTGTVIVSDGKININTATHGELTDLPGVGNAIASRIIDYRTKNGGFEKIEDIQKVSGIGEKRYEAIMELIKVE